MNGRLHLDDIDRRILEELPHDDRISSVDLSDRVGLSPAPCLTRVRTLEETGVSRKYVTLLDPISVQLGVMVFVQASLDFAVERRLEIFENEILQRPEILECYLMTGDADYLRRVIIVPDATRSAT